MQGAATGQQMTERTPCERDICGAAACNPRSQRLPSLARNDKTCIQTELLNSFSLLFSLLLTIPVLHQVSGLWASGQFRWTVPYCVQTTVTMQLCWNYALQRIVGACAVRMVI